MDKKEVDKIKKAIYLIHIEDKYYEGLNILAKLIGWPEVRTDFKSIPVVEYLKMIKDKDPQPSE